MTSDNSTSCESLDGIPDYITIKSFGLYLRFDYTSLQLFNHLQYLSHLNFLREHCPRSYRQIELTVPTEEFEEHRRQMKIGKRFREYVEYLNEYGPTSIDEDMMILGTQHFITYIVHHEYYRPYDRYEHDPNDLHVSTCQACKDIKSVDMIQYE